MATVTEFKNKLALGTKLRLVNRIHKQRKSGEHAWNCGLGSANMIGKERTITAVKSAYVELNGSVLNFPKKSELIELTDKGFTLEYVELGSHINSVDLATTLIYEFC